jgi:hypothetical protein
MVSGWEKPRRRRRRFVFDLIGELAVANLVERTDQSEGEVIVQALRVYQWLLREHESGSCSWFGLERREDVELRLPFIGRIVVAQRYRRYEFRLEELLFTARDEVAP